MFRRKSLQHVLLQTSECQLVPRYDACHGASGRIPAQEGPSYWPSRTLRACESNIPYIQRMWEPRVTHATRLQLSDQYPPNPRADDQKKASMAPNLIWVTVTGLKRETMVIVAVVLRDQGPRTEDKNPAQRLQRD
ncbi:hypothetical protein BS50DRAFT_21905 [Corynespora cassiicola Philippines]|uniref:Uncharacterized protein n=1 Tax=Corynespora cassiicola Philippines TaxID=1448308 RepID=A0A2T2PAL8_CORCC|nr:hypothetical protein BS50DRAFT_21905 [Corynespora cassiicola Philippines]